MSDDGGVIPHHSSFIFHPCLARSSIGLRTSASQAGKTGSIPVRAIGQLRFMVFDPRFGQVNGGHPSFAGNQKSQIKNQKCSDQVV